MTVMVMQGYGYYGHYAYVQMYEHNVQGSSGRSEL